MQIDLHYRHRPLRLCPLAPAHPLRAGAEARLREAYRRCHDGAPTHLPHALFALLGPGDEILATAGVTPATGDLLCSRYLDASPIGCIAAHAGHAVPASCIAEIGQLTACRRGMAPALMVALTAWLARSGYAWGVATTTDAVRGLLAEMGIATHALAPARPQCLGAEAGAYGRYYEHDPWVICGSVDAAHAALARRGDFARLGIAIDDAPSAVCA